jgi:hypothetical protein
MVYIIFILINCLKEASRLLGKPFAKNQLPVKRVIDFQVQISVSVQCKNSPTYKGW